MLAQFVCVCFRVEMNWKFEFYLMEQITEILFYGQYDNMFVVCQHVCFMFFFYSLSLGNFSLILIVFDKYTYFVLYCLWPVAISNRNERGVYYLHTLSLRVSHTIKMRQFQFQFNQLLFFICFCLLLCLLAFLFSGSLLVVICKWKWKQILICLVLLLLL